MGLGLEGFGVVLLLLLLVFVFVLGGGGVGVGGTMLRFLFSEFLDSYLIFLD